MMILVKMVEKKILLLVFRRHKVLPPIARMTRLATCVALLFPFSPSLPNFCLECRCSPNETTLGQALTHLTFPCWPPASDERGQILSQVHELIFSPPFPGAHICWGTLGEN